MDKTEVNSQNSQEFNPINQSDKLANRIEPEIETDKFSLEEEKEIVKMVISDSISDIEQMAEWLKDREQDINDYEALPPSELESLEKKEWQSDRNLGMCPATCDSYQATLLATCLNPSTIRFKSTKYNDSDRSDDLAEFTKWGLTQSDINFLQEADDFIHNRITQGFSVFKYYWKVGYNWVDKRIPIYDKEGNLKRYDIKTEKERFEHGVIENISNLEDFLTPTFGKTIEELDHCIHVLHKTGEEFEDLIERRIFKQVTDSKRFLAKLKHVCFDYRIKQLGKAKAEELGLKTADDVTSIDLRSFPIDIFEWYGMYTKNGRRERYQFRIEPTTKTFLSGKPLRKVPGCRDGRYPFRGSALIRRPGFIRGKSLPRYIRHIINALNNIYNQKSDFQYVENCPFGFHKPDENYDKQVFDLEPGVSYPTNDPKNINFPVLGRSMAWAESDIRLLLELLERMTGAASYFMTNQTGVSGTATRDAIINEKSETRFGLWVNRIIKDITEAIDGWIQMYQDCAPPTLGERVLGENGRKLFPNMSIATLQGNYKSQMSADIISGSKTLEKSIFMQSYQMAQSSVWFNPQINPRGNWQLTVDTFKKLGLHGIEDYMPEKPKTDYMAKKEASKIWQQFMQGEVPEIEETVNTSELLAGLMKIAEERYFDLDEEYRPSFDSYMFKLAIKSKEQMKKVQEEMIAQQLAQKVVHDINRGIDQGEPIQMPIQRDSMNMPQPSEQEGRIDNGEGITN